MNDILRPFLKVGNPKFRFVITRMGCPACKIVKEVINRLNYRLPISKRVRIIDNTSTELFSIKEDFVQEKLHDEDFEAYPITYIDGNMILGAEEYEFMFYRLSKLLEDDFQY